MEVSPRSRIEPGGRLVEEEEGGATNDGHGDIESSPLTAGERLQLLVGLFFKADHAQEFVDRPWVDIGAIEIREVGQQLARPPFARSEEHTSELQSRFD